MTLCTYQAQDLYFG